MVQNIFRLARLATRLARRRPTRIAGWLLVLLTMPFTGANIQASHAEGYPERTIKIVVPFPAGGPTDVAARLIAQSLSSRLRESVIIENHCQE
jgi:tripartite-type tricarboxylate transporter receptor subunit TctC